MVVTKTSHRLKPGSVVRCRTRRYLVESVLPEKEKDRKPGPDQQQSSARHGSATAKPLEWYM